MLKKNNFFYFFPESSTMMNFSTEYPDSVYYVTPPIPDFVFSISICFLVITGTFGIFANISIIGLFFFIPAVSMSKKPGLKVF